MKIATGLAGFGLLEIAVFTVLVLITHPWGAEQYQRGKRIIVSARDAAPFDTTRPFILYLRGFADDYAAATTLGEPTSFVHAFASLVRFPLTEEEHLARALGAFGAVVAVGQPGEDIPLLGAKRVYVDDGNWQEHVRQLARQAQFVILRVSNAPGVIWELETILRELPPEKVAILVPEREEFIGRELIVPIDDLAWRALERAAGQRVPYPEAGKVSPKLGTLRALIWFTPSRQPMICPLVKRDVEPRVSRYPLADALRDEFAPLMARAGIRMPRRFMWLRRGLAFAVDYTIASMLAIPLMVTSLARASAPESFVLEGWWYWMVVLTPFAYFAGCEVLFGATVGKWASRLQVAASGREGLLRSRILLRNVLKIGIWTAGLFPTDSGLGLTIVAALFLVPPFIWGAMFYDFASGTRVVGTSRIARALRIPREAPVPAPAVA
jgi:hypothetical protein